MRHHHTGEARVVIEAAHRVSDARGITDVMGELRGVWRQRPRIRCNDCEMRHSRRPLCTLGSRYVLRVICIFSHF